MKNFGRATKAVAVIILCGVLGNPALAAKTESTPEEKRGVLIGGVIGASVGGPFGAGVGAILGGAVIGKTASVHRMNRELNQEIAEARRQQQDIEKRSRTEIAKLKRSLAQVEARVAEVDVVAPEVPIQFRTASSDLELHYQDQLAEIARLVVARPDARVFLSGFADRRGDADYNQKLSEARVEQVKTFLVSHGVAPEQVGTRAYGATRPVSEQQTPENDFFDRRVVMHFSVEGDTPVAIR